MSKAVITSHQPSMTEWFAAIGEMEESQAFREEDNRKTDRLEALYQMIGAEYERPEAFEAADAFALSESFQKLLCDRGDELCAFRLVPKRPDLEKMRLRGCSIKDTYEWMKKQEINPSDYTLFVCPHSETLLWSATFVVTASCVFGEIVRGMHSQLTHGDMKETVYRFIYDFQNWSWSKRDDEVEREMKRIVLMVHVPEEGAKTKLVDSLDATFSHDFIEGYFEATIWPDGKAHLIDYNRMLPKYINIPTSVFSDRSADGALKGSTAYPGVVQGRARIVDAEQIGSVSFERGDILVTHNTDVRFLPLMKDAGAIVTNLGGILTHASIVSRELKKPCIVGTKNATEILRDGDLVEVQADKGVVRKM